MDIYPNHTKRRLAEGKIAIGMGLHLSRTIDIAAVGKTCGYDWLFIDMEHSALDIGIASQIASAALAVGISPLVRVPGKEHHHASRLLDSGAQGIVIPHVDSIEEAQRAVSYCKYPPLGHRSIFSQQPQFGPYMVVAFGILATTVAIVLALSRLNRAYEQLVGEQQTVRVRLPWMRNYSDQGDSRQRAELTVFDAVLVFTALTALVAFVGWFFLFAGSPLPVG